MLRYNTILSTFFLAISMTGQASAANSDLRPFSANYDIYRAGMHIAIAKLSLKQSGNRWRWKMSSKARGIYSWLTKKRPFTETTFVADKHAMHIQTIVIADAKNKKPREFAQFDWHKRKLQVERRGKRRELTLASDVYDYLSIHLLAAAMSRKQLQRSNTDFYRKGKLVESLLTYNGQQSLATKKGQLNANVYELRIIESDSTIRYYYDAANPLLPLRIEGLNADHSNILRLRSVEWSIE